MPKPMIQIGDELREMNAAEFAQWQKDNQELADRLAAEQLAAAAKISARAKLATLGLTDAEINAFLGA